MTEQLELPLDFSPDAAVAAFRTAFDASKEPALWNSLIVEELNEFDAALQNLIKEYADIMYVTIGYSQVLEEADSDEDLTLELADRIDTATSVVAQIFNGVTLREAFDRVHASNMSKLGEDGKPVRREDGKILKGPLYQPVDFTDLVGTAVA